MASQVLWQQQLPFRVSIPRSDPASAPALGVTRWTASLECKGRLARAWRWEPDSEWTLDGSRRLAPQHRPPGFLLPAELLPLRAGDTPMATAFGFCTADSSRKMSPLFLISLLQQRGNRAPIGGPWRCAAPKARAGCGQRGLSPPRAWAGPSAPSRDVRWGPGPGSFPLHLPAPLRHRPPRCVAAPAVNRQVRIV